MHQIDLPKKLYSVIDHRVQLYLAPNGKIMKAKLPEEIRKAGLFSTRMAAFTGYLKARCHTARKQRHTLLWERQGIVVDKSDINCYTKRLNQSHLPEDQRMECTIAS